MRKIEYIDFAKGYAILSIVLYHALQRVALPPMLGKAIIFGGTGVHLFFLLSGFGLGLSKSTVSVGDFYKRRLTKIWLPYIFVLTISLLSALALGLFPDRFKAWAAGVFLYQMFFEKYVQSFGGHFWFISTIIQFYLVFPALVWAKRKIGHAWAFFGLALLVSVLWWELVFILDKGHERIWNSCFLQFLWEFALGMALAELEIGNRKLGNSSPQNPQFPISDFQFHHWWLSLPVGLFFTGLMIFMILKMGEVGRIFNDIPALIGYAALSYFLFKFGERFVPPIKQFFLWVGGFSFSLYLVHVLVLELYLQCLRLQNLPVSLPMLLPYFGLALAAGWAFEPVSQWWVRLFEHRKSMDTKAPSAQG